MPLATETCQRLPQGTASMSAVEIQALLSETPGWRYLAQENVLQKVFTFRDYAQTTTFVNQVVALVVTQDHHPDITFGYQQCSIRFQTHVANGITKNDFICAARINQLTGA